MINEKMTDHCLLVFSKLEVSFFCDIGITMVSKKFIDIINLI